MSNTQESVPGLSFMRKTMMGMFLIGETINGLRSSKPEEISRAAETMAFILGGHFDQELNCVSFYQVHGRDPRSQEELDTVEVLQRVERIKDYFRSVIRNIFEQADAQEEQLKRLEFESLQAELRTSNKPHELGTVAEIAEKYGISKSEVRRRKADGTLHELTIKA